MHILVSFFLLFVASAASAQDVKEKYRQTYGSVESNVPVLGGTSATNSGSAFLYEKERRLWVTAYHVIPGIYAAVAESGKYLSVNKAPAKLLCWWREADMAILQSASVDPNMEAAKLARPAQGMRVYAYSGGSVTPFLKLAHSSGNDYELVFTRESADLRTTITNTFEGFLFDGRGGIPTGARFFSLDRASRTGFSGGPIMNSDTGEVVGISVSIEGGIGYASSVENVRKLVEGCKL